MLKNFLQKTWRTWIKSTQFICVHLCVVLVFAVGLYFTATIFINFNKDTTGITNTAFAIVASLAALSFSCGRAIKDTPEDKDRFAYAGERHLHAAIMMIMASILKYAYLFFIEKHSISSNHWYIDVLPGLFVGFFFFIAFISAMTGLLVLNELLWSRFNRYPDFFDFLTRSLKH